MRRGRPPRIKKALRCVCAFLLFRPPPAPPAPHFAPLPRTGRLLSFRGFLAVGRFFWAFPCPPAWASGVLPFSVGLPFLGAFFAPHRGAPAVSAVVCFCCAPINRSSRTTFLSAGGAPGRPPPSPPSSPASPNGAAPNLYSTVQYQYSTVQYSTVIVWSAGGGAARSAALRAEGRFARAPARLGVVCLGGAGGAYLGGGGVFAGSLRCGVGLSSVTMRRVCERPRSLRCRRFFCYRAPRRHAPAQRLSRRKVTSLSFVGMGAPQNGRALLAR